MANLKPMNNLQISTSPEVESVFSEYPETVREKMNHLRRLILETAHNIDEIKQLEETLKWGEPSFLVKKGSTIRIDWKKDKPGQVAMYFKCTSKLVPTFKTVYKNRFDFEGNRAIIFQISDRIPEAELKNCIRAALLYHRVKKLPTLGIRK